MSAITLPKSLVEKLKRIAKAECMSIEELIVEKLTSELDFKARIEVYWEMSETYLRQAKEELTKGNLRQASEKLWGSATQAVKAIAYEREERRLTSHRELWEYVNRLVMETGDEELGSLWRTAVSMHVNFYEGWAPKEEVERAIRDVTSFLERLRKLRG